MVGEGPRRRSRPRPEDGQAGGRPLPEEGAGVQDEKGRGREEEGGGDGRPDGHGSPRHAPPPAVRGGAQDAGGVERCEEQQAGVLHARGDAGRRPGERAGARGRRARDPRAGGERRQDREPEEHVGLEGVAVTDVQVARREERGGCRGDRRSLAPRQAVDESDRRGAGERREYAPDQDELAARPAREALEVPQEHGGVGRGRDDEAPQGKAGLAPQPHEVQIEARVDVVVGVQVAAREVQGRGEDHLLVRAGERMREPVVERPEAQRRCQDDERRRRHQGEPPARLRHGRGPYREGIG